MGKRISGKITDSDLEYMEQNACPGCGSCAGMFTANTMDCVTEVMGMGLPGNGTVMAVSGRRKALAHEAGEAVMKLLKKKVRPKDIITKESIFNALTVDMALGGSTNSVLHLMAIANEAGIDFPLSRVNEISQRTPTLCILSPAIAPGGEQFIEDLARAGGISAVMKELKDLLYLDQKGITGKTVGEIIAESDYVDRNIIKDRAHAYSKTGGLAMLLAIWRRTVPLLNAPPLPKRCLSTEDPLGSLTLRTSPPGLLWTGS